MKISEIKKFIKSLNLKGAVTYSSIKNKNWLTGAREEKSQYTFLKDEENNIWLISKILDEDGRIITLNPKKINTVPSVLKNWEAVNV